MLSHLHITNYALISRLDIDLPTGFSVVTGETGAGKSIILGALSLLAGARAEAKAVKTGEKKCVVEGTFAIAGLGLADLLEEMQVDSDEAECIVRREVSAAGKSRAFVNDTPVTLAQLKKLTDSLIDIHSQHRNLLLGNETFLLDTLDAVANNEEAVSTYREAFAAHAAATRALKQLQQAAQADSADADYLSYQLNTIDAARLLPDEQTSLEQEQEVLSHAEEIKGTLYEATAACDGGDGAHLQQLRQAAGQLARIARVYPAAEALSERLTSCRLELDDILSELTTAAEGIAFDPARAASLDERLSLIYSLQKKYHVDSNEAVLALAETFRQRLDAIESSDERIEAATQQVAAALQALILAAGRLNASRHSAAETVATALRAAVTELGMPQAVIHFAFTPRATLERIGAEGVELLFSANRHVPPQDVARIASGGEIARLMLALKALLSRLKHLPTVVFDEIDTGVSGTMAERMAQVMAQMGEHCQVICITHLPQIAARGAHHFRVEKVSDDTSVTTQITPLTPADRIDEVAKMLSGEETTQAAIDNARALLQL